MSKEILDYISLNTLKVFANINPTEVKACKLITERTLLSQNCMFP